ncbi:LexA family protein [Microbulbifer sp. SSSA007]|uniref:LexA family protein n=1 Tax=Microbulbifer sp. SSSA007 TaxID=3243379 RepID=UPI004039E21E
MDIREVRRENLRQIVEGYASKAEFGRVFGVDPTYISQLLNGHRNLGEKAARKLENTLGLDQGTLDNTDSSPATPSKSHANVLPGPKIHGRVPLISWVQAGEFCEAVDLFEPGDAEDWLPCPCNHSDSSFALRIQGDSMTSPYPGQRSYPPGTIIFVDPNVTPTNGCRVIAKLDGEVTFKSYQEDMGRRYLRPINPSYESKDITDLAVTICGVIIGSFLPE